LTPNTSTLLLLPHHHKTSTTSLLEASIVKRMNSKMKTAPQPPQPPILKVIMVGAGGVGKSALTLQFMYDEVSVT
jgi:GTPase SAR1 family protein